MTSSRVSGLMASKELDIRYESGWIDNNNYASGVSAGSSASSNVTALVGLRPREPAPDRLLHLFQGAEAELTVRRLADPAHAM